MNDQVYEKEESLIESALEQLINTTVVFKCWECISLFSLLFIQSGWFCEVYFHNPWFSFVTMYYR